jgi:hypothetical protein
MDGAPLLDHAFRLADGSGQPVAEDDMTDRPGRRRPGQKRNVVCFVSSEAHCAREAIGGRSVVRVVEQTGRGCVRSLGGYRHDKLLGFDRGRRS